MKPSDQEAHVADIPYGKPVSAKKLILLDRSGEVCYIPATEEISAMQPLLEVNDLHVTFTTRDGLVKAVNGTTFALQPGKVLTILGESGSGKSVTLRSLVRLLPRANTRVTGEVRLKGMDLYQLPEADVQNLRGRLVAMIFQEPMTALDPVYTVGEQIVETLVRHQQMARQHARSRALELLELVQIPSPKRQLRSYPHEISGGMRQRAMIAIALACNPELLLADEPTTALDVTVQAQILYLLRELQTRLHMAVIFVTHDLGVAAEVADDIAVMYAGQIVEYGSARQVLKQPAHPYTRGLMNATVHRGQKGRQLIPIPGQPPDLTRLPPGCSFAPRCPSVQARCLEAFPDAYPLASGHMARCFVVETSSSSC